MARSLRAAVDEREFEVQTIDTFPHETRPVYFVGRLFGKKGDGAPPGFTEEVFQMMDGRILGVSEVKPNDKYDSRWGAETALSVARKRGKLDWAKEAA